MRTPTRLVLERRERFLGASDCESVRDVVLAQPVAAVSSLGYVAAGGWLIWEGRGLAGWQGRSARTYASLLVLVGAGSVLYHGPQGPGAELLHDAPVAVLVGQAVAVPVLRWLRGRPMRRAGTGRRVMATGGLAALAAVGFVAGRTGSPLCDPDSLVQLHAVWHLAGAAALAIWGTVLWPAAEVAG
jgi:hypothetical protein